MEMNFKRELLTFLGLLVVAAAVCALTVAWQVGTFDRVLHPVGLNVKECARNSYGATFCGEELEAQRGRWRSGPLGP